MGTRNRGSSNGRTTGSGPVYWGSNPYPRAKKNTANISRVFLCFGNEEGFELVEMSQAKNCFGQFLAMANAGQSELAQLCPPPRTTKSRRKAGRGENPYPRAA